MAEYSISPRERNLAQLAERRRAVNFVGGFSSASFAAFGLYGAAKGAWAATGVSIPAIIAWKRRQQNCADIGVNLAIYEQIESVNAQLKQASICLGPCAWDGVLNASIAGLGVVNQKQTEALLTVRSPGVQIPTPADLQLIRGLIGRHKGILRIDFLGHSRTRSEFLTPKGNANPGAKTLERTALPHRILAPIPTLR